MEIISYSSVYIIPLLLPKNIEMFMTTVSHTNDGPLLLIIY